MNALWKTLMQIIRPRRKCPTLTTEEDRRAMEMRLDTAEAMVRYYDTQANIMRREPR